MNIIEINDYKIIIEEDKSENKINVFAIKNNEIVKQFDLILEKPNVYKIYKLIYDNNIIYIGRTKLKLSERKRHWYKNIPIEYKLNSKIELIEETEDRFREIYWIDYYMNNGYNLYNKTSVNNKEDHKRQWERDYYRRKGYINREKRKKEYYLENKNINNQ